jgi:serine/threonine protein phosphatase PrpC
MNDKCMIIATDGLWDVMNNEQALSLAMEYGKPTAAAQALVDRALFWGSLDNITAVVVFFAWDVLLENCVMTAASHSSPATATATTSTSM